MHHAKSSAPKPATLTAVGMWINQPLHLEQLVQRHIKITQNLQVIEFLIIKITLGRWLIRITYNKNCEIILRYEVD